MKLTWFGNTTFRAHIGGQILVLNADAAPAWVDRTELIGGADVVTGLAGHAEADPARWTPRPAQRLLDAGDSLRELLLFSMGEGALLVDADEESPLLFVSGAVPALGRWAEKAVVVLVGDDLPERAETLLDQRMPRLLVLAGEDEAVGATIERVRDKLDGAGLMALEPAMAMEI